MHASKDSMWQEILKNFAKFWELNRHLVINHSMKLAKIFVGVIIGLCVGFGILLSCLGGMLLIRRWKRDIQRKLRRKYFTKNQGLLLEQLISSDENASSKTKIFFSRRAQKGYKWLWYITYTWTWRPWNGLQRYLVRSACSSNKNFKDHGVRWNW